MSKAMKAGRSSSRPSSGPSLEYLCGWGGALVVLVAMVYAPTFSNGFIWDDGQHVKNNVTLESSSGLKDIWFTWGAIPQYYPLVHTTFWIEHHFWGDSPRGYHFVNLALHAVAVVLLWRVLERLAVPGAWLAAVVFAVHPINVESVAWISERKNVLSLALALGSLLAYLHFAPPTPEGKPPAPRSRVWLYGLALGLYVLALFSKTVTASVPAVLLVVYWWKQGRIGWRDFAPLLPFFAVGLALASVTVWQERVHVGASGDEWDMTPAERILVAGRAAWFYAAKIFWPQPVMFFYPRWHIDPQAAWQYAFPAAAVALLVVLWAARKRIGRGPLAAALIFGGVLVPALGFFNLYPFRYSFVADHFQYHACIALIALACAAAVRFNERQLRSVPWAGMAIAVSVVGILALVAHNYTYVFRDLRSLYEDVLAKNPGAWVAQVNLGDYYVEQGKPGEALEQYLAATKTVPQSAAWQTHVAIGNAQQDLRRPADALQAYQQALESAPEKMQATVHLNLASALADLQRFDEALVQYDHALAKDPNCLNATTLANYGVCLAAAGKSAEAVDQLRKALKQGNPARGSLHVHIGDSLVKQKQYEAAIAEYRQAALEQPELLLVGNRIGRAYIQAGEFDDAYAELQRTLRQPINPELRAETFSLLGDVQLALGDANLAIKLFGESIRLQPKSATAHLGLGRALAAEKQLANAEEEIRKAIELDAQNADAHYQLGQVLLARGQAPAAIEAYQAALALQADHAEAAAALAKAQEASKP